MILSKCPGLGLTKYPGPTSESWFLPEYPIIPHKYPGPT